MMSQGPYELHGVHATWDVGFTGCFMAGDPGPRTLKPRGEAGGEDLDTREVTGFSSRYIVRGLHRFGQDTGRLAGHDAGEWGGVVAGPNSTAGVGYTMATRQTR